MAVTTSLSLILRLSLCRQYRPGSAFGKWPIPSGCRWRNLRQREYPEPQSPDRNTITKTTDQVPMAHITLKG